MGKRVELTNVELLNLLQGCNLIQTKFDLIASIDFRFTKIINTIQPHVKEYQEAVQKVREQYRVEVNGDVGEEESDESDEPKVEGADEKQEPEYKIKEGKEEEFQEEVKKLDEEKVELQLPTTFHIDDFVDAEGKQLKFKDEKLGGITYLIDPVIVV